MNIKWVDKAFRGLLLDEKEIDYKYEPKSSRDVKTIFRAIGSDERKIKRHTHFDDLKEDFIEELTVFGFSPFTHKTFMEQLKDKDIMKYKLKQFNYGLKNYVKKAYTSPNQRSNSVLSNQKNVSLRINNNNSSSSSSKGHFLYQMLNKVGKLRDEDVDYMFKNGNKNLDVDDDNGSSGVGSSSVRKKEGLGRMNSVVLKKRNKNKFNCKGGYISNSNSNCNTYRSNVNIKSSLSNKRIISHSHTNSNKFVKCINTNNNVNNALHKRNKTLFYEFKSYMQPSSQKPILFETQPHFQRNNNNNTNSNSNSNSSNIKIPKIEKLYSITSHNEHNPPSSSKHSTYNNNNNNNNSFSKPKTVFEANKIVFTTDANPLLNSNNNNTHYRFLEKIEKNPESIFSKAKKISNKY